MTIHFKVDAAREVLFVKLSHKGKIKQKDIGPCKSNQFNVKSEMVLDKHPDYDILAPMILNIKIKARKLILTGADSIELLMNDLFAEDKNLVELSTFGKELIHDMELLAAQFGKNKDWKSQNKLLGNIKVYRNALVQFDNFYQNVTLISLDANLLNRFKSYQLGLGNSKATVHQYLRTIRAIYHKGISKYKLFDEKPFVGVFSGLSTKSYSSKKKYILRDDIVNVERLVLSTADQKYIDLWLLCFYFGGCDLIDLYYLKKNNFKRGRVYFERNKTNNGMPIDLKIHPKAQRLIDKYTVPGDEWLLPWPKDKGRYDSFRSQHMKVLKKIQLQNNLEILPIGGALGIKVARHTFATLAKKMLINEDLLRELMGHERDEVDNYYKDKYPEKMRDEALFGIISSFECVTE